MLQNKYTLSINTDGTVDAYDHNGCKISHFCGFWDILHEISKSINHPKPSEMEPHLRFTNPVIYLNNNKTGEKVEIDSIHFNKMLEWIKTSDNSRMDKCYEQELDLEVSKIIKKHTKTEKKNVTTED